MNWPVNGITLIDHPVYAVADLDASRRTWGSLGFTVPPRGSHIEWGTGNLCIMFPDDYLEMRGIADPTKFLMHLEEHLEEHGEGLMGVAFATEDVHRSYQDMLANGVDTAEPRKLTRNFEHPEGWTKPSFELCVPAASDIEGLMHVVVIQHLTPELLRRDDFLRHDNGAVGINSMTGVIFNAESAATKHARLFGAAAVNHDGGNVRITTPSGQFIDLMPPDEFSAEYGFMPAHDDLPSLGALEIRVSNLDTTRDVLERNGIPNTTLTDGRIRVEPEHAQGSVLDFSDRMPG